MDELKSIEDTFGDEQLKIGNTIFKIKYTMKSSRNMRRAGLNLGKLSPEDDVSVWGELFYHGLCDEQQKGISLDSFLSLIPLGGSELIQKSVINGLKKSGLTIDNENNDDKSENNTKKKSV